MTIKKYTIKLLNQIQKLNLNSIGQKINEIK